MQRDSDPRPAKGGKKAATRRRLLSVARRHFARDGYAAAATEAIVAEAEMTRGALYYQFRDKQDLFRAVVEEVAADLVARIGEAADEAATPVEAVVAGSRAFLAHATAPEIRRILLVDAPTVLGWAEWRAIDARHGAGSLAEGLRECARAGLIEAGKVRPLTHLLSGALNEAALALSEEGPDPTLVRAAEALIRAALSPPDRR